MIVPVREVAQHPFELEQMLRIVDDLEPRRVLEVGVWHGGTLWHWLQTAEKVVGIDDTMFEADDWRQWADEAGTELHLLQGNSHAPEVVEAAGALGPYDFVFIDADHSYSSVKEDWESYGPMVTDGGVVAFHDIAPRDGYGVSRLWAELKPGRRTVEIYGGVPSYCGIGLLWA